MNTKKAGRGYTLLELVWVLALSSVFGLGAIQAFASWMKAIHTITQQQEAHRATLKAHALIESALHSSDYSRLPMTVFRTPGDNLTLPNGVEHPVTSLRGTSLPRVDSDVVTIIEVSPSRSGEVQTASLSGATFSLEACGISSAIHQDDYKSVVVTTLDGPYQAVGKITNTTPGCLSFCGSLAQGLVSAAQEIKAPPLLFFTVRREFSLFVDRSGELRFVSHTGGRVLENQPVTRGYRSIHFETLYDEAAGSLYKVTVHASYTRPSIRFLTPSLLQRSLFAETLQ